MRTGPHPLPAHVALASATIQCEMLPEDAHESMASMLAGVKKYQAYGALPAIEALPVVARVGEMQLRYAAPIGAESKHPVLLVPSLINRHTIFDLCEARSFVRWLAAQGHHVYLIDWGDLARDAGQGSLDAVVRGRLNYCAEFLVGRHDAPVNAIGYCMGGTLLVGGACLAADLYHKFVFIAPPWDFSAAGHVMVSQVQSWAPSALSSLLAQKKLPCSHVQALFASLYPGQSIQKFSQFLQMEEGSAAEQLFVAVEDWLNEGVDLPYDVAHSCIQGWFLDNEPARGAWGLGEDIVQPQDILQPSFVVASDRDKLVAYAASEALHDVLPNSEIYNPKCGHIGMMAGRSTIEDVWSVINAWLVHESGV